ncbi:glycosyltransferase [Pseudobutyrivibrio xylanivorans]|uniref:Glycosyl transferase family 2 n=1 Tax=Pseudobutyrivibrio xylanivorans TaxID=185007 RepID=A0A5P6VNG8_PSEXY|nr:glycosyltransferase [Pseudobutyrivibrio xylanivorans]QFJ53908.1 glycosyl transferase family 2 [Pseudobutyrivibrio xylanivorans]
MSNIDISVVVATYKQEKYIGMTLDSILAQKFSGSIEVIVGDDCSPDSTGEIVRKYGNEYSDIIKAIVRPKNLGAFKNFEDLLTRAQGKYIALIEGDDYWIDENKLQEQFDFMEANPDYVATFGKSIIVDENNERQVEMEQYIKFAEAGEYTIDDFDNYLLPGQTASSFYRKDGFMKVYEVVRAIKTGRLRVFCTLTDRLLVLSILAAGRINKFDTYYSAYRYILDPSSNSWSSKNDFFNFRNEAKFLISLHELEKIARFVGMKLNYDDRRRYEFAVIADKKGELNFLQVIILRVIDFITCNNKGEFIKFMVERKKAYHAAK